VLTDQVQRHPVVPYEYALDNVCTMKQGNFRLGQRDDIVYWNGGQLGEPDGGHAGVQHRGERLDAPVHGRLT
jgi:hypothetical protein